MKNFSNSTFRAFIAEYTDIDVYLEPGYVEESSKAKKLRKFWNTEDDSLVGRAILELIDIRDGIITSKQDCDGVFVDEYANKVQEIKTIAREMVRDFQMFSSNEERLNADTASANMVLNDLVKIGERVCSNSTYNAESSENSINDSYKGWL